MLSLAKHGWFDAKGSSLNFCPIQGWTTWILMLSLAEHGWFDAKGFSLNFGPNPGWAT